MLDLLRTEPSPEEDRQPQVVAAMAGLPRRTVPPASGFPWRRMQYSRLFNWTMTESVLVTFQRKLDSGSPRGDPSVRCRTSPVARATVGLTPIKRGYRGSTDRWTACLVEPPDTSGTAPQPALPTAEGDLPHPDATVGWAWVRFIIRPSHDPVLNVVMRRPSSRVTPWLRPARFFAWALGRRAERVIASE